MINKINSQNKKSRLRDRIIISVLSAVMVIAMMPSGALSAYAYSGSFSSSLRNQGFPESYIRPLEELHQKHPNWTFKARLLDYDYNEAFEKQYNAKGANLVATSFPDSMKAVRGGTYNFDTHQYIGKDGPSWVTASKAAVAYYFDPRNWLTESGIFMFEPFTYDPSYQTEDIVKKILAHTAVPQDAAKYYIEAANQSYEGVVYNISPVYLAAKTRIELGSGDFMINGHEFEYGDKVYSECYNTYNIGASDSADGSAALKGLVYAGGGREGTETSYLRPWNSLEKAIKGGALFISDNFISNNQYSLYYERFNVLNGFDNIGTHQYATSIFNAATLSSIMQSDYSDMGLMGEAFSFEIPVFRNMPETPAPWPPNTGTNNCYLDNVTFTTEEGEKIPYEPEFDRFRKTFRMTASVPSKVKKLHVNFEKNDMTSVVSVSGTSLRYGENKITVKCKASSGLVSKYQYFYITRERPKIYMPYNPSELKAENLGGRTVKLTWKGDKKATGYRIRYKETSEEDWKYLELPETEYTAEMEKEGACYDFKVRAYYEEDGERNYSPDYTDVARAATFGEQIRPEGGLSTGYMTVKLTWPDVTGADGYKVMYHEKYSEDETVTYVTEPEFSGKMPRAGKGFDFYVTPYRLDGKEKLMCGTATKLKRVYTLRRTEISFEEAGNHSVRVRWDNVSGESGYEIRRSDRADKGFKVIGTMNKHCSSRLDTTTKKGRTYYYKVRPYKEAEPGRIVYGPYSDVKEITR